MVGISLADSSAPTPSVPFHQYDLAEVNQYWGESRTEPILTQVVFFDWSDVEQRYVSRCFRVLSKENERVYWINHDDTLTYSEPRRFWVRPNWQKATVELRASQYVLSGTSYDPEVMCKKRDAKFRQEPTFSSR